MKRNALLLSVAFLFSNAAALSAAMADDVPPSEDKIAERTRAFVVKYPNGDVEHVVARYDGLVEKHVWQTGKVSTPLTGHIVDDRACHWDVNGLVKRQLSFQSQSGVTADFGVYEQVWYVGANHSVGPKNIIQAAGFYHKTCGDARGSWTNDITAAGNNVRDNFDAIVDKDAAKEAENIKQALKAINVTATSPAKTVKAN